MFNDGVNVGQKPNKLLLEKKRVTGEQKKRLFN